MKAITTSIFDLFKIGPGPSSSHTIGPMKAGFVFRKALEKLPDRELKAATSIEVRLFGSLSATGKGHGTDRAITGGLLGWEPETCNTTKLGLLLKHEKDTYKIRVKGASIPFSAADIHFDKIKHSFAFANTMIMRLHAGAHVILEKEYYSIGGGFIRCKGEPGVAPPKPVYKYDNMNQLKERLKKNKISLIELILRNEKAKSGKEKKQIFIELDRIMQVMEGSVERGIKTKGVLPGPIGLHRKAPTLYKKACVHAKGHSVERSREHILEHAPERFLVFLNAYALAASEENAAGHKVVTAPTSGSAGVIPAVLYLLKHHLHASKRALREGMLVAAAIGFIVKENASISGAEVGCQGEIGVASAMAAALLAQVNGYPIDVIENAAEIALEHHLGMTCDPIGGYVQIPCVERNAVAAVDAYNAYLLASVGDPKKQKLKFDQVVAAMLETGRHMSTRYKETSRGGLALCAPIC